MKVLVLFVATLFFILLLVPSITSARRITRPRPSHHDHHRLRNSNSSRDKRVVTKPKGPDTLQVAGSSLPNCSHACGSCSPCRLVMVSFVCASLEEAESCPMTYKCMCNHKSYPVP